MKRWLGYLLLGLLAYFAFLVVRLPASFAWSYIEPQLKRQSPGMEVAGIGGTLWRGEAAAVSYSGRPVGRLSWRVTPLSLLGGNLNLPLSLQLPEGYLQGGLEVPFGLASVNADDIKGQLPLGQLQTLFPYNPVTVGGTLAIDISRARLDADGKVQALQGKVNWVGAEVIAPQRMALGDLQAQLEADEQGVVTAKLSDLGGPLSLDADFVLKPEGSYSLTGTVAAGDGAGSGLTQALGWLGKPDSRGRYRISWKGRL